MMARYDRLANSAGYQEGDSVAVPSYQEERKVTQAADLLGGFLQHYHPDE
jgi:hypothetical protein